MSIESTMLWLDRAKNCPWYKSQMPVTDKVFKRILGRNHSLRNEISDSVWKDIENLIPRVENREIIFLPASNFIVVEPFKPVSVKRLTTNWSLFARCTCGSNQFLPVMIEKEYAACYQCLPPSQYKSIGATQIPKSLIHTAVKDFIEA